MGRKKVIMFIVIAFGMLAVFFLGPHHALAQFGLGQQQIQKQPQVGVLSCAGGRYVFGQISDSSKDQFMLDTLTGRLWRVAESGEIGLFLRVVPYKTEKGEYGPVPEVLPKRQGEEGRKQ